MGRRLRGVFVFCGPLCGVLLAAALALSGCYWQPDSTAASGNIDLRVTVPAELSGEGLQALQSNGFIVAMVIDTETIGQYRTRMPEVYDRLVVDAVFDAGLFRGITRRNLYSHLDLDLPSVDILGADFRGAAQSVAQSTGRGTGTLSFENLPAGRNFFVAVEAHSPTRGEDWVRHVDVAEAQILGGRTTLVDLSLQDNRGVLYHAAAVWYGVPLLRMYQAGGRWNRYEPEAEVVPFGFALEYRGLTRGRHRHHLYFFEEGQSFDRTAVHNPDVAAGGRLSPRSGKFLEYILVTDELLYDDWPNSLSVPEGDLERGVAWLGGTTGYDKRTEFYSLEIRLGGEDPVLGYFDIAGTGETYDGLLCFDPEQPFSSRDEALGDCDLSIPEV